MSENGQAESLKQTVPACVTIFFCKGFGVLGSYYKPLTNQDTVMSQSLSIFYTHATFGTKGRNPWIHEEIANDLHAYMASIFKELDSPAVIINSMPDHIHVLFRMSKTVTVAEIIEETKKSSSKWMKHQPSGTPSFYWQRGYGAFSVSGSHLATVTRYIARQKEHHKKLTYREEVERLMKKYKVEEYNPKYYWD